MGALFVLTILLTKSLSKSRLLLLTVLSANGVTLALILGSGLSPLLSGTFCFLLPFALYPAYQITFNFISRKREKTEQRSLNRASGYYPKVGKRERAAKILCLSLFLLSVVYMITPLFALKTNQKGSESFIAIRDQILLGNPFGKSINNFYYKHSPYATEVIKPLVGKSQFSILYLGRDHSSLTFFLKEQEKLRYFVRFVSSKSELEELLKKGGVDLILADMDSETGRELYKGLRSLNYKSQKRVVLLTFDKSDRFTDPGSIKILKPITSKKMFLAIKKLSQALDEGKGLRKIIGISIHQMFPLTVISLLLTLPALLFFPVFILSVFFRFFAAKPAIAVLVILLLLLSFSVSKKISQTVMLSRVLNKINHENTNSSGFHLNLLKSKDPEIRSIAAKNLYKKTRSNPDRKVTNHIIPLLTDPDPRVRMYAASALGNLGERNLIPELTKMTGDPQINVRYKAVEAMGKVGGSGAISAIKEVLLKERNWYVSNYALLALRKSLKTRGK